MRNLSTNNVTQIADSVTSRLNGDFNAALRQDRGQTPMLLMIYLDWGFNRKSIRGGRVYLTLSNIGTAIRSTAVGPYCLRVEYNFQNFRRATTENLTCIILDVE